MTNSNLIKIILEKEEETQLYKVKFLGIPMWRIFRFETRTRLMKIVNGFEFKTKKDKPNFFQILVQGFISFYRITLKVFFTNISIQTVVYSFPRLHKVNSFHIDKFTDPVIDNSNINKSFLIFQRPLSGKQFKNRYNYQHVVETDFFLLTAKIIGFAISPIIFLIFKKSINSLYKKAKKTFKLNIKIKINYCIDLSVFLILYFINYLVLKKINPKKVLLVDREVFFPVILACKKLNIKVYEIQHGVTHRETALYSGPYDDAIDPDYFLIFGEAWRGLQFSMPLDKIINIGWAYKKFIKELNYIPITINRKAILIISEPNISDSIVDATCELAEVFPNFYYHIRLHPQESLNSNQLEKIQRFSNIIVQDNSLESSLAILEYLYIVGRNSSVLYEALSSGKLVARLNYLGIHSERLNFENNDGFYYLENHDDFNNFIASREINSDIVSNIYDDFKVDIVDNL